MLKAFILGMPGFRPRPYRRGLARLRFINLLRSGYAILYTYPIKYRTLLSDIYYLRTLEPIPEYPVDCGLI